MSILYILVTLINICFLFNLNNRPLRISLYDVYYVTNNSISHRITCKIFRSTPYIFISIPYRITCKIFRSSTSYSFLLHIVLHAIYFAAHHIYSFVILLLLHIVFLQCFLFNHNNRTLRILLHVLCNKYFLIKCYYTHIFTNSLKHNK